MAPFKSPAVILQRITQNKTTHIIKTRQTKNNNLKTIVVHSVKVSMTV